MTVRQCKYDDRRDFCRVRDFLVDTYALLEKPVNWRLERWNYARYFVIPMVGAYGQDSVSSEVSQKAIDRWAEYTRLWENDRGEVVAVTALEYPQQGDVFFLRHPDHDHVLDEMFEDAERTLVDPEKGTLSIHVYEHDLPLQAVARQRGYRKEEWFEEDTELAIRGELPEPVLPEGFRIQSMADDNDLERRRKAFGRGFDHEDPVEWPSLSSCQELQKAPDYRQDRDLYVVAPDGEFVSFCILWWDERNRLGILEPVGTVPEHRRRGLGRAAVLEAIRRVAALGAERVFVGSDQAFYLSLGFELTYAGHHWEKEF